MATTLTELQTLANESHERVAALIGDGHLPYLFDGREPDQPPLLEMTESVFSLLSQDPDGFFLIV
ncbi:MAG: alkaline phosphatase, partial [Spirochaetaceae bacterium]|nr:alkaline phosphatase [Spirochaetaceae bacterium]